MARLSLRVDGLPELNNGDIHFTPGDSVIIRAIVEGAPEAYHVPVITASDPTAMARRSDGTALLTRQASLVISATAAAKSPSTQRPTLTATGKLSAICTLEMRSGIQVSVLDSASGQPPTGVGSMRLRATDGVWGDSITAPFLMGTWATAWERAGTYVVTVDADGYRSWRRDGVVVTRDLCHARTLRLNALLQRP